MQEIEEGVDLLDEVVDKELSELIDEWLAEARPDRYEEDERDWQDSVIEKTRNELLQRQSAERRLDDHAKRLVRGREGQAVKRTHKELRNIARLGRLPLGWGEGEDWKLLLRDLLHLPLKIAGQRVRFGAASASDFEEWITENHREQDEDDLRRIEARKGARLLVELLKSQQVRRSEDLEAPETSARRDTESTSPDPAIATTGAPTMPGEAVAGWGTTEDGAASPIQPPAGRPTQVGSDKNGADRSSSIAARPGTT